MNAAALDATTPPQRLIVERAFVLTKELEAASGSAPAGQVIDRCESLLRGSGREFLRLALQDTLQDRVQALEIETSRPVPAPVEHWAATKADRRDP